MNEKNLLILDQVAVGYGQRAVLSDVSLALPRGCFTAVVGANGSGKSTLLKTILGLLPPLSGQLRWQPVDGHPPSLGYVPQRDALDPLFLFTSYDVVLQACCGRVKPGRFFSRSDKTWARECLESVGAADIAETLFSQLSGGQKQRVLIARALAVRPDLLLLDEPTAGIDPGATTAVLDLLRHWHQTHGLGILLVTHDLGELRTLAEDVLVVHRGRVDRSPVSRVFGEGDVIGELFQPPGSGNTP